MKCPKSILFLGLLFLSLFVFANSSDSVFLNGTEALSKGDYARAESFFTSFLEREPNNETARFNLALVYFNTASEQKCLEEIKQIPFWKKQARVLNLAAWCAYNVGMLDSAKLWLNSISDGEKNAEMLLLKAIMLPQEKAEEACTLLSQALLLDPGFLEALFYRAKCNLATADTAAAIKDLNVFLTHRKKAAAFALRASISVAHKDLPLAIKDYEAAFEIDSNLQWKYAIVELHSKDANYEEALLTAKEIQKLNPKLGEIVPVVKKLTFLTWLNANWIYLALGLALVVILIYLLLFKK